MAADTSDAPAPTVPGEDPGFFVARATHVTRDHGSFTVYVVEDGDAEHAVLVRGDVRDQPDVLCRVSSACVMSTALGSAECDCSGQVDAALEQIDREGRGVLVYLMDQEGRGHGLKWKVRALRNKNHGMDTFTAVEHLGLPPDIRDYSIVHRVLKALEIHSVVLLTNNPEKRLRLEQADVPVSGTRPLEVCAPRHAWPHMVAKKQRGHVLTNSYMDYDTAEIPLLKSWMPPMRASFGDHSHDGASTLSQ